MALPEAVETLVGRWPRIAELASFSDMCLLRACIRDIETNRFDGRSMLRIIDILRPLLSPGDPIFDALAANELPYSGGPSTFEAAVEYLARVISNTLMTPRFDLHRSLQERLLAVPKFESNDIPELLQQHDGLLIELPTIDGYRLVPRFQFVLDRSRPHAIVLAVNRRLDAARDPFGAADWWLGRHSQIQQAPAALLGLGQDENIWTILISQIEARY